MLREFFSFNLNLNESSWNDKFWLSSPEYVRDIFSLAEQNSNQQIESKGGFSKGRLKSYLKIKVKAIKTILLYFTY